MEVTLEEPREGDLRFEIDGLPLAVPPDAAMCLRAFDGAVLDGEGQSRSTDRFFIRFGRSTRFR